ncbi:hypothetical protein SAMN04488030_0294 [Aliiroseovarius halocynthiae]|uniref:Flagellar export protein FliJ n=1 Tax=Aliiroseovarius halocynthiae TaxID=985055 RepID=A0A545SYH1_9RHOB|nr:hypothetical protein [Aliiroseovarius halocynthiae]TQV70014.1 hypothetical protein FIL88_01180 [Aliiroseovarius halocynthiae]SMR70682.1 hypothetical protein SAMN04488030_0294 [Aliiroseovarius halocynthiae]
MSSPSSQLSDLTALILDRAMAELSNTSARIAGLEKQITDLRERLGALPGYDVESGQNPALSSGHFDHWQKQAQAQVKQLNVQLAQALADHEERLAETRQAFGRNSAINAIQAKMAQEQRNMVQRRVEHQ